MTKKKLDTNAISNELAGASLFFSKPQAPTDPPKTSSATENKTQKAEPKSPTPKKEKSQPPVINNPVAKEKIDKQNNELTNERTLEQRNVRFNERRKIRHTFDIFGDQLLSLREIAIEQEKTFGQRVLLGELVQQALDMFITKERNK